MKKRRFDILKENKDDKGFSLIELIVVIVILAILVAVTVGGVYGYVSKSRINTDINNANTITGALQILTVSKEIVGTEDKTNVDITNKTASQIATDLGITDTNNKLSELLPNGVPSTKAGGTLEAELKLDGDKHIKFIKVVAYDSDGTALVGED